MTDKAPTANALLRRASVPRYTSYPPANHFTQAVGSEDHAAWLRAVPEYQPVSIYLHVPFCRRLCHFCACRTQGTLTDRPIDDYVNRLGIEVWRVAGILGRRQPVSAIHFGGGTPTILRPDLLETVNRDLRAAFDVAADAEISVEVDPTELDDTRLDALAAMGLTRASIGVQDFAPEVQNAIGREQSVEVTAWAASELRKRGAASLNVDLIYGLPFQTSASLRATLDTVTEMRPDRAAIYGYAHVPQMARRQRLIPPDSLPGPAERIALFEISQRMLVWAGYKVVGIDHFALPEDELAIAAREGRLARNFQGYTTDTSPVLIGLGASALSKFPQGHVQNAAASGAWAQRIDAGTLASARGFALAPEDRCRAEIIDRIMCDFAVDLPAVAARHGFDLGHFSSEIAQVHERFGDEVAIENGKLRLTASDGRFARLLCAEFDGFLSQSDTQYSRAV